MSQSLTSALPKPLKLTQEATPWVEAFRAGRAPAFEADELGQWIHGADWLIEQGELTAAEIAVRALNAAQPGLEWAANLCGLFDRAPAASADLPDLHDKVKRDVQVVRRPGAEAALVVFSGARHRVGMPLPMMHRWLAATGASLIYLRDFHGLCYLRGVASLGEGLAAAKAGLSRIASDLGARRIICFGGSGGGYAALRYALELDADAISLGSPANLAPAFNAHMNHGGYARELAAAVPGEELDLRRLFEAAPRRPRALVVYGERNWNERVHAEHMAGLDGCELYPVSGYGGHATAAELIRRDEFLPMLETFCAAPARGAVRA